MAVAVQNTETQAAQRAGELSLSVSNDANRIRRSVEGFRQLYNPLAQYSEHAFFGNVADNLQLVGDQLRYRNYSTINDPKSRLALQELAKKAKTLSEFINPGIDGPSPESILSNPRDRKILLGLINDFQESAAKTLGIELKPAYTLLDGARAIANFALPAKLEGIPAVGAQAVGSAFNWVSGRWQAVGRAVDDFGRLFMPPPPALATASGAVRAFPQVWAAAPSVATVQAPALMLDAVQTGVRINAEPPRPAPGKPAPISEELERQVLNGIKDALKGDSEIAKLDLSKHINITRKYGAEDKAGVDIELSKELARLIQGKTVQGKTVPEKDLITKIQVKSSFDGALKHFEQAKESNGDLVPVIIGEFKEGFSELQKMFKDFSQKGFYSNNKNINITSGQSNALTSAWTEARRNKGGYYGLAAALIEALTK
jgi:hypothetical protein